MVFPADNNVTVIVGPTASGKSSVALNLAVLTGGEIVNSDSRQIYKHLSAGTAKPSQKDFNRVPHHLYDFIEPDQHYNAGIYRRQAREVIRDILNRNKHPIVVGGTGLYIRALFDGLSELPPKDEKIREELTLTAGSKGKDHVHSLLKEVDPESARNIPANNLQRVIRAYEVYLLTGKPISQWHKTSENEKCDFLPSFYGLKWDREALKERIIERCSDILPSLLEEARMFLEKGWDESYPALEGLGYRDAIRFLRKEISRDDLYSSFLLDTFHYAKRQRTWFEKDGRIRWLEVREPFHPEKIAEQIKMI